MKIIALALSIILASVVSVVAQQHPYRNPYGYGQQERQEPQLRYNPLSAPPQWSYEQPSDTLQYNAPQGTWEYAPPGAQLRFNPFSGEWERE